MRASLRPTGAAECSQARVPERLLAPRREELRVDGLSGVHGRSIVGRDKLGRQGELGVTKEGCP